MKATGKLHPWDVSSKEARTIQQQLSGRVVTEDRLGPIHHVAGIDVGFEQTNTITRAAIAILSFPDLKLVDQALARRPTSFPYVPGLLSFREVPAVLDAFAKLRIQPDLLLCDGQGIAPPQTFRHRLSYRRVAGYPVDRCCKKPFDRNTRRDSTAQRRLCRTV